MATTTATARAFGTAGLRWLAGCRAFGSPALGLLDPPAASSSGRRALASSAAGGEGGDQGSEFYQFRDRKIPFVPELTIHKPSD